MLEHSHTSRVGHTHGSDSMTSTADTGGKNEDIFCTLRSNVLTQTLGVMPIIGVVPGGDAPWSGVKPPYPQVYVPVIPSSQGQSMMKLLVCFHGNSIVFICLSCWLGDRGSALDTNSWGIWEIVFDTDSGKIAQFVKSHHCQNLMPKKNNKKVFFMGTC